MSNGTEEAAALANKITQDIADAMKGVEAIKQDSDAEHKALAKGILAMRDADIITCARMTDTQKDVREVKTLLENGAVSGPTVPIMGKPIPVRYVVALAGMAMLAGALIVVEAIRHNQLGELATAIQIAKGNGGED